MFLFEGFDEMQSTIENLPKKSKKTRKKKEEIAEKGQKVQEIDEIMKGSTSPPGVGSLPWFCIIA